MKITTIFAICSCFISSLISQTVSFQNILNGKDQSEKSLTLVLDSAEILEFEDPVTAEKYSQFVLRSAQKHSYKILEADAYTNLGLLSEDASEYKKAVGYFNCALGIFRKENNKKGEAGVYNNLGSMYDYSGICDSALFYYNKSLVINKEIGNELGYGDNLYNMGVLYSTMGKDDLALKNWYDALKIFEKLMDYEGIGSCEHSLGLLMRNQKKYDKSLEFFDKAYNSSLKSKDERLIADVLMSTGNVFMETGKNDKAIEKFREAKALYINSGDLYGVASVLTNIGDIFKTDEQMDSAIYYYSNSNKLFIEVSVAAGIAHTYAELAECYYMTDELGRAIENCDLALKYAEMINSDEYRSSVYFLLYRIYEKQNRPDKALEFHVKYSEVKDSLFNDNKQKIIEELQTVYETEKKEQQIKLQKTDIEKKEALIAKEKLQKYGISAIGLLFIILSFVVFRSYRHKRKANILLSDKNEKIMQQNEEISAQRDEIAAQRDLATNQRDIISRQQKDIKDSIRYAFQIQSALFPTDEDLRIILKDYFIFYRPRDIVSGDFYWVNKSGSKIIILASDCTGHGVPGAFMSMLGIAFLNEIVNKENITDPALILNRLRENIILAMKQHGENVKQQDGMDSVAITIDRTAKTLEFAGANNPLYIVRSRQLAVGNAGEDCQLSTANCQLTEVKGDKMPIGIHYRMNPYTVTEISVEKGDMIYLFSDGYADQTGGESGQKLKYKPFKEFLVSVSGEPVDVQKIKIEKHFTEWKGSNEQIDDVLVMGIKI